MNDPSPVRSVAIATAPFVSATLPVLLMGALAVQLRRDLGFDEAALGLAIASARLMALVASGPSGWFVERVGPTTGLRTGSIAAGALMIGAAAVSSSWGTLVPFIALSGAILTMTESSADLWLTRAVSGRQGLAFGAKQSAGPMSALLAGLAVPTLAVSVGWRPTFVVAGVAAVLVAAVVPWRKEHRPDVAVLIDRDGDVPLGVLALLSVALGLGAIGISALTAFLVSGAVATGMSESAAGLLFAAGAVLAIATRMYLGHLADTRSGSLTLTVAGLLSVGAVGYLLMAMGNRVAFLVGAALAFSAGWGWPGLFVLAIVRSNPNAPAVGTAYARIGGYAGTILGPVIFGILARGSYATAWLAVAAINVGAALVLGLARRRAIRMLDDRKTSR